MGKQLHMITQITDKALWETESMKCVVSVETVSSADVQGHSQLVDLTP